MKPDIKKIIITNLPYLLFVYLFGKVCEAYRLAARADLTQKMLHFMDSLAAAFANGLPSFHPFDLCIGVAGAVLVRLAVYLKGKNAKKYHHGMEYGSARWGTSTGSTWTNLKAPLNMWTIGIPERMPTVKTSSGFWPML